MSIENILTYVSVLFMVLMGVQLVCIFLLFRIKQAAARISSIHIRRMERNFWAMIREKKA